jgi:integrase/recombinase XerD
VTKLIQRMREELVRRNYAETTIRSYLQTMEEFRRFANKRLDHLGPDEIRKYQVHLLEEKKLGVGTVAYRVAALRFFYVRTLKRPAMKEDLPYPHAPEHTRRLPTVLTPDEVSRLIDSARNLFHYAMLLTMYSAGLRRSELCRLKVSNIDSGRMVLRVERGKGGVDREVPLNPKLLTTLREYWRWMRPKTYLFSGSNGWRADKPITPKVIWEAVRAAVRKSRVVSRILCKPGQVMLEWGAQTVDNSGDAQGGAALLRGESICRDKTPLAEYCAVCKLAWGEPSRPGLPPEGERKGGGLASLLAAG